MHRFNLLFKERFTCPVTPSESVEFVIKKWGKQFSEKKPSFFPELGVEFELLGYSPGEEINSSKSNRKHHRLTSGECQHLFTDHGILFPNVHGLVIANTLDMEFDFLKKDFWYMGMDYPHHLPFNHRDGHMIAYFKKVKKGEYKYGHYQYGLIPEHVKREHPHGMILEHNDVIIGFNK